MRPGVLAHAYFTRYGNGMGIDWSDGSAQARHQRSERTSKRVPTCPSTIGRLRMTHVLRNAERHGYWTMKAAQWCGTYSSMRRHPLVITRPSSHPGRVQPAKPARPKGWNRGDSESHVRATKYSDGASRRGQAHSSQM